MKLYFSQGACSLAPRIVANELGLKCDYEAVDLKNKKTEKGDDYYRINPKGAVPVLEKDNGEILTENAVILQYLVNLAKNSQLFPGINSPDHFKALEWLNYVATEMHKGVGIMFNSLLTPETKKNVFVPAITNKLKYLDEHFKQNKFLIGDQFTIADAYMFVILNWLPNFQINIDEWPNLSRYYNEIKKRQSVQKSLKDEGLS